MTENWDSAALASIWPGVRLVVDRFVDPRPGPDAWDRHPAARFDLLVASVGYERRSRFVAEELVGHYSSCIAWAFEDHRELSFTQNLPTFRKLGSVVNESEAAFAKSLKEVLLEQQDSAALSTPTRIAADISSMTRQRVAHLMTTVLVDLPESTGGAFELTMLYAPAKYTPQVGSEGPIRVSEPMQGFEGWALEPEKPTACILALGFEHQLAIAAIEQLEPADVWLLVPHGVDERYDAQVLEKNKELLAEAPPGRVLTYDVRSPYVTYLRLQSLIAHLADYARPVVVPLGPKLFAGVAMVAALIHQPDVAIWRLSADVARQAQERVAAGAIVGLQVATHR